MAWQKTVNLDATVSNENLTATFSFVKTGTDGYEQPIKELGMMLIINLEDGTTEAQRVLVDDHLTAQQRSDLNALLIILRDAALTDAGFTNQ